MIGSTNETARLLRRIYREKQEPLAPAEKLRVIQLGSYPAHNRGARSNLQTIHQRLLARGHESSVIDLTGARRVKQPGVCFPRSTIDLARLLLDTPAAIVHLHLGGALSFRKLALAAAVGRLCQSKTVCTLHLGGHFYPQKGLRGSRWGATGVIMRQFDNVVAVNPEIASFVERLGVHSKNVSLFTPFPRLRTAESLTLSAEVETFCRHHTPLLAAVCDFEPGSDLTAQFDVLGKVRERYPSAGLLAVGSGSLHFKYLYERAMHRDCNHIELTGALSPAAVSEVIQRANVFIRTPQNDASPLCIQEAMRASTPVVSLRDVETTAFQVLNSLQVPRPRYEDAPCAALSDGVDDIIRLYKQLASAPAETAPLPAPAYELPGIGWGI